MGVLMCGISLCATAIADLTEGDFPNQTGNFHKQNGWEVQKPEAGGWTGAWDAVQVEQDETGENMIVWQAGARPKEQVRIVRPFPITESEKVRVVFQFKPGSDNLGGRLYFMQSASLHVFALQFRAGHIHILESGQTLATDTGIAFSAEEWNHIEIRVDFATHTAELIVNGIPAGQYEIAPNVTGLGALNLFAGGQNHTSSLKGLTVESVSTF